MKTFLLICAFNASLLAIESPSEPPRTEKKVLQDERKSVEAARDKVARAYLAAAKVRQEGNIIDADPESAATIPGPKGAPETERYVKLKKEYLTAKAALQEVERQSRRKHADF